MEALGVVDAPVELGGGGGVEDKDVASGETALTDDGVRGVRSVA